MPLQAAKRSPVLPPRRLQIFSLAVNRSIAPAADDGGPGSSGRRDGMYDPDDARQRVRCLPERNGTFGNDAHHWFVDSGPTIPEITPHCQGSSLGIYATQTAPAAPAADNSLSYIHTTTIKSENICVCVLRPRTTDDRAPCVSVSFQPLRLPHRSRLPCSQSHGVQGMATRRAVHHRRRTVVNNCQL